MEYKIVSVRPLGETDLLGFGILKIGEGNPQFEDVHLYSEDQLEELGARHSALVEAVELRKHWPDARDPDVMKLTDDPTFEALVWIIKDGERELADPSQPMKRIHTACEIVARYRVENQ